MAANTSPIFVLTPENTIGTSLTTANTAMDGTGTVVTVFTAGADGGFVNRLIARALGTNVATVLRVFLNNGSTNATASNNSLILEVTCPATTASAVAALAPIDIPLNLALKAGYKLNVTIGTSVSAGIIVTTFGGQY